MLSSKPSKLNFNNSFHRQWGNFSLSEIASIDLFSQKLKIKSLEEKFKIVLLIITHSSKKQSPFLINFGYIAQCNKYLFTHYKNATGKDFTLSIQCNSNDYLLNIERNNEIPLAPPLLYKQPYLFRANKFLSC